MPTEAEIKQHYEAAPVHVKELLSSPQTTKNISRVARYNNIDEVLDEVLFNEVGLVLLGFETVEDFTGNITTVLEIPEEVARSVTTAIVADVFSKMNTPDTVVVQSTPETTDETVVVQEKAPEQQSVETTSVQKTEGFSQSTTQEDQTEDVRRILRENSKTVSIKDFLANLK